MTDEDRATELANMHRCLDAGARIWTYVAESMADGSEGMISRESIMALLPPTFSIPLSKTRQDHIMQEIADVINEYQVTSCGAWTFCHMLHHIIFDTDLPQH